MPLEDLIGVDFGHNLENFIKTQLTPTQLEHCVTLFARSRCASKRTFALVVINASPCDNLSIDVKLSITTRNY